MPVIPESDFRAPVLLSNRHIQTLWANVLRRKAGVKYSRERLNTPDGDFLLLDWSLVGSGKLVILSHGLEGHSRRPYMVGMVKALNAAGYDALAWNFRSCGGELNRKPYFYYAGASHDLDQVIRHAHAQKQFPFLYLLGFSLGGNKTLKWLGENAAEAPDLVRRAVAISVPVNLSESVDRISNEAESVLYMKWFLGEFKRKLRAKARRMPGTFELAPISKIKTIRDFDNLYTAPLHGYPTAEDMYRNSSSLNYLNRINLPTLLINAKDDPFMGPGCYPLKEAEQNPHFFLEMPDSGGHVGFFRGPGAGYWTEQRVLEWLAEDEI